MKLTCPECFSEFEVPDQMLGASGRRVRCNQCQHIWYQDPHTLQDTLQNTLQDTEQYIPPINAEEEPENTLETAKDTEISEKSFSRFDDGMSFEPIPESLYPENDDEPSHADSFNPIAAIKARLNKEYLTQWFSGFVVAAVLFGLFLWIGALVGLHKGVLRNFYSAFGIVYQSPASVLEVENLENASITHDGEEATLITGQIHNKSDKKVKLPLMEISVHTAAGLKADTVYIRLENNSILAGQSIPFEATIPASLALGEALHVRFID